MTTASSTTTTTTTANTTAAARPTVKTSIRPTRPSTAPKTTAAATNASSPNQQTTILSTAPDATSPSASATLPTASKTRPTATKPVSRPTLSTRASTTTTTTTTTTKSTASSSTTAKPRPTSHTRASGKIGDVLFFSLISIFSFDDFSVRPATATTASATTLPKRSNSAHRPATADPSARTARTSAAEASASGTTVKNQFFIRT